MSGVRPVNGLVGVNGSMGVNGSAVTPPTISATPPTISAASPVGAAVDDAQLAPRSAAVDEADARGALDEAGARSASDEATTLSRLRECANEMHELLRIRPVARSTAPWGRAKRGVVLSSLAFALQARA